MINYFGGLLGGAVGGWLVSAFVQLCVKIVFQVFHNHVVA